MRFLFLIAVSSAAAAPVDFVRDVRPIFEQHCFDCHGEKKQKSGLRLDLKAAAFKGGDNHGIDIVSGEPSKSPLIQLITSTDEDEVMPPKGALSVQDIETLTRWVAEGAAWPDGVDLVKVENRLDHWSFKPLVVAPGQHSIDAFIDAKLAEVGMTRSAPAEPISLIRRLSFDLTGLPPTPEEVAASLVSPYEEQVERLLASPRYGEHWAQHWLDVVRYADTHGFEVNTERPNAWPYRDYVIRAFNSDTPYDQFIQEQIVGDSMGQDAATGFLVTASVLLPGQIGKDAPSIRLARQDSLDEIVNNIGQTFLGLSVGCARCHDHKFDPISQQDYYAMQAFVAGVEYADRPMSSPEAKARMKEVVPMQKRLAAIDEKLSQFVPLAEPGSQGIVTSAELNTEAFAPVEAKFVRFSIYDANLHPKLGLIEPCIDEIEVFSDKEPTQNLALQAKVTASGSRRSASHKLEHLNDGQYGNARSWMSDEKGRGWVMLELPALMPISKVIWSRDRLGKLKDRLPTVFTLEVGPSADKLIKVGEARPLRPTIRPALNTDRIVPVTTKRLRFTVSATNSLEPCIDELEVINSAGENIALASRGAKATTSGDIIVADRHDPHFINDGMYGNSRSWLSNGPGQGWVEIEFPSEQEISRIVWSRDREEKLEDRLPTEYRIEVAVRDGWKLVADSTDRHPWVAGTSRSPEFTTAGLTQEDTKAANGLLDEKKKLEAKIKDFEGGQLAFAGKFRAPDEIRLLSRGDPEQPKDLVVPAVLSSLGALRLSNETPEQQRRHDLAKWIASTQNTLTARVMVNRIWQGHFGTGLVDTPSDFGRMGSKPSHPELLDWLATEFIRSGWSVKHIHRLIVMSGTYRQSSVASGDAAGAQQDADVRLLWRFPSVRLEAESIRDSMLAVSGRLNLKMYGRGYDLFDKRGGLSGFKPVESYSGDGLRRMIYAHKVRRETEAVFGAFDCPDAGQSTAKRRASTTPIQALNLFNSQFTLDEAAALAVSVEKEVGRDTAAQITRTYQRALSRSPSPDEVREAVSIVQADGLAVLCRALFNSNEFLFVP